VLVARNLLHKACTPDSSRGHAVARPDFADCINIICIMWRVPQ